MDRQEFHTRTVNMAVRAVEDANNRLIRAESVLSELFSMEDKTVREADAREWEKIIEDAQLERRQALEKLIKLVPNWDETYPILKQAVYETTQAVAYTLDNLDATRNGGVGC